MGPLEKLGCGTAGELSIAMRWLSGILLCGVFFFILVVSVAAAVVCDAACHKASFPPLLPLLY